MKTLVIDPGHGGSDPGAQGFGLQEKNEVLKIAQKLRAELTPYKDLRVLLTRTSDTAVSLRDRTNFANNNNADMFLSLHINGFHDPAALGYEDFSYNQLPTTHKTVQMQRRFTTPLGKLYLDNSSRNRGSKQANFFVLRETRMCAILFEFGFITNRVDNNLLRSDSFVNQIVAILVARVRAELSLSAPTMPTPTPTTSIEIRREVGLSFNDKMTNIPGAFTNKGSMFPISFLEPLGEILGIEFEIEGKGDHVNIGIPQINAPSNEELKALEEKVEELEKKIQIAMEALNG